MLSDREKFLSFYSMFLTTHAGLGVYPSDLEQDGMGYIFNAVLDTIRKSNCPTLTEEDAKAITEDFNIEMFKIKTVIDEAIQSQKLGEKV
tara:strand:- start:119 stop:388 length:270 start_codon:yes stop_codon:yes gene_type:complete